MHASAMADIQTHANTTHLVDTPCSLEGAHDRGLASEKVLHQHASESVSPSTSGASEANGHIQSENVLDALVDLGQRKVPVPVGVELPEELVSQRLFRVGLSDRELRGPCPAGACDTPSAPSRCQHMQISKKYGT
jgi:hypothetical protein